MDNDYWSFESCLSEQQKIPCTLKLEVGNHGNLLGASESDLHVGGKVSIPMWLAPTLILNDWLDFNIPPPFMQRVKRALNADARSVRLSALVGNGGEWYGFGKLVADILEESQAKELQGVLLTTFKERFVDLMDQAQHFGSLPGSAADNMGDRGSDFREGLEMTERELFLLGQESAKAVRLWYESTDRKEH
ncbi:hypothetical protein DACRYDRAFT_92318 [Dacryopinax primogenitus]|uniref:DNA replication complex GINS protein PSF3 n=1 Tax=Dacryopinax primogenitus (strain DJM 731) TaxID=1858805 RepID=M5GBB5_DACPD|nr:uncharacterized protein DACRYDRAFT_92318 [Dacryopinax primogenitus]EJU06224.1 hypothetical protein DACRYDRAFT_92318 [Dacryopinax primogenitus]